MPKTPKGSVTILESHGRLQLRFVFQGRRIYFSLGIPDTSANRKVAKAKAGMVEADLIFDRFDESLEKYRAQAQIKPEPPKAEKSLAELWDGYVDFKRPQVSPNTVDTTYRSVSARLRDMPHTTLAESLLVRDWLISNLSVDLAKRTLVQLNACCKWAKKSGSIFQNPFDGMASELRVTKNGLGCIQPFTPEEALAIQDAFKGSRYEPIVRFLFLTGCRTGEARGLKWSAVNLDAATILFKEALSGKYITDTKTHKARIFPCNGQLKSFLSTLREGNPPPTAPVFEEFPMRSFQDVWMTKVGALVEAGEVSRYRSQYNTRHTFITRCLEAGVPIPQIAEWVGNSAETILKHYAGIIQRHSPPEL